MGQDIVVVDDDPDTREILELVLGTLQIPIREANDGIQALELVTRDPPLLVMLDLSMPQLDGEAVLRELRARPATAKIPVMVFTARSLTVEDADRLQVPPHMILRKGSLSMTHLRALVMKTLSPVLNSNLELAV